MLWCIFFIYWVFLSLIPDLVDCYDDLFLQIFVVLLFFFGLHDYRNGINLCLRDTFNAWDFFVETKPYMLKGLINVNV